LKELMTGSFTSEKQAEADSSYFNISLHMYPIWTKDSADWLYVEQALFEKQEKPYRQRVYKLEVMAENIYKSKVFKLKNDSIFIGKWKNTGFFNQFDQSILDEKTGCEVILMRIGSNEYQGSTSAENCKSSLRGAAYATSQVNVKPGVVESWDQGFDADGNQVWGATQGGYVFEKIK